MSERKPFENLPTIEKIAKRDAKTLRDSGVRMLDFASKVADAMERGDWGMVILFLQDLEQAAATFVLAIPHIEPGYKAIARDPEATELKLAIIDRESLAIPVPPDPKAN